MKLLFKQYPATSFVDHRHMDTVWHGPVDDLQRPHGFGVYFATLDAIQAIIFGDFKAGITVRAKGVMLINSMTFSMEGLFVDGDLFQGSMAMYHSQSGWEKTKQIDFDDMSDNGFDRHLC